MIRHFESYNLAQFEGLKANQEISFEKCFIFFFQVDSTLHINMAVVCRPFLLYGRRAIVAISRSQFGM